MIRISLRAATALLACSIGSVAGTISNYITIDYPGATGTIVNGLNNHGEFTGTYWTGPVNTNSSYGFYGVDPSHLTGFTLGSYYTYPIGINDAGVITGLFFPPGFGVQGFLRQTDGSYISLAPYPPYSEASGINDSGHVVGIYNIGSDFVTQTGYYGWYWDGATFEVLPSPYLAGGINNPGHIVGSTRAASACFFSDSSHTSFTTFTGPPGSTKCFGQGINDSDMIVGGYLDSAGLSHGFLWNNNLLTTLDIPGASETDITGINNRGQMAGYYYSGGVLHGFVTTPEPATFVLFGVGLAACLWRRRRK